MNAGLNVLAAAPTAAPTVAPRNAAAKADPASGSAFEDALTGARGERTARPTGRTEQSARTERDAPEPNTGETTDAAAGVPAGTPQPAPFSHAPTRVRPGSAATATDGSADLRGVQAAAAPSAAALLAEQTLPAGTTNPEDRLASAGTAATGFAASDAAATGIVATGVATGTVSPAAASVLPAGAAAATAAAAANAAADAVQAATTATTEATATAATTEAAAADTAAPMPPPSVSEALAVPPREQPSGPAGGVPQPAAQSGGATATTADQAADLAPLPVVASTARVSTSAVAAAQPHLQGTQSATSGIAIEQFASSGAPAAEAAAPAPSSAPVPPPAPTLQPTASAAAPTAGPTATPAPTAPLNTQLATPLFSLANAGRGDHVLTITVTPDNVGPVTVRAHVTGEGVRMELFAPNDLGRDSLRAIMPDLRRDLAGTGMNASLDLSSENQPPEQNDAQDDAQRDASARRGAPTAESAARHESSELAPHSSTPAALYGAASTIDVMA
ncbi:flagellar hook-length control protein FliK [Salinibacterium sp. ZJ454]|uniref:flagellar hook-length control protein FliK n=1 Tax=Salinibacterium sp. ZJ454 TaxID=2708339 RepID=UPI00142343D5|nr:flagellar hook-length control protein FliK [Salinibacterium sp. ZJ454]